MKKNVTSQLPHSLVVHPLLRKILDPPQQRICRLRFYIDFIEGGISEKPPLCLELKKELEMFQRASCTSLSVKVIQRQLMFQKGSVRPINIVFKQRSPSVPETAAPRSCTSSGKQMPQEKIVNKSTDSGSDK